MSISIQLPPELEEQLRVSANKAGIAVDQYVLEILEKQLQPAGTNLSEEEALVRALLEKINLGIPVEEWKRYNYLKDLRSREQLDPEDHAELIALSDKIEMANAKRMEYLYELSSLKKIPLQELMNQLGIKSNIDD
jgi:predicted DNA-binding protein